MKKEVAIVHYNTPALIEAAILSLRKAGGVSYHVTVFDNSDESPFKVKMRNVTVIDNTKGQLINFEKELEKYPDRSTDMGNIFGSFKHMLSVQYLMDNVLTEGFLLMDSDVLIKSSVDVMFMPDQAVCGHIQSYLVSNNPAQIDRLLPMLLWLNVPMLKAGGARFFDPERCFALQAGGRDNPKNWYDTGAALLEDIRSHRNGLNGKNLSTNTYLKMLLHYQQASWRRVDVGEQLAWLQKNRTYWAPDRTYKLGPCTGKDAGMKIYICTHRDFEPQVKHPSYAVLDVREEGDTYNGLRGGFYSEILSYLRVAKKKNLPKMIGFCGWRKYFRFMSDVPAITEPIVSGYTNLGKPMYRHYQGFANIQDLDLCTQIINEKHPEFKKAWYEALNSYVMHPCSMFVMPSKDFRRMMKLVSGILDEFVKRAGDIDARIEADPDGYHLTRVGHDYAYRIGGQLGERLISAWIDWQLPDAKKVPIMVTHGK